MPRYIDADAYEERLADKNIYFPALYRNELINMPTADVAPKSEVERWRRQLEAVLNEIPETKREVAREIFAEIEEIIDRTLCLGINAYSAYEELKKKYTEGEE